MRPACTPVVCRIIAFAAFENARKLDQDHAGIWSALGHAYAVSGDKAEAQKVKRLQDPKALSYVAPYNVAIVYAGLGNRDQTFAWLDRAYKQRSYYLPVYLTTNLDSPSLKKLQPHSL